ncbi:hypothetical protein L1887_23404 [Cichorium endivia]|nr:hypothetical protein L1887_23404 [Cichorium endivia]
MQNLKTPQSAWGFVSCPSCCSLPPPMEKLKSAISQTLILSISQSNPHTLPNTCSSLHGFLNQLPQFHQMVEDLAHKETSLFLKNKESALEFKLKGNKCLSNGDNSNALRFYTQALRIAPRDVNDMGKNLVATLYVNRAAVLQKMGLVVESLHDCNMAVAICRSYSKAWYRRSKANTLMGNYENAVCDLKVSLHMEHSISGKKQIEGEINLILHQHKVKDFPPNVDKYNDSNINDQPQQIQLQCVTTETKGRGMVCLTEIPPATLLHTEEPYAAIISKKFRETHCHFCFNELPTNIFPCLSCSMALYCSKVCQANASWQDLESDMKGYNIGYDLEKYVENVIKESVIIKQNGEHKHECGVNWPAALPSEIVLAGRVIVKYMTHQGHFGKSSTIVNLDLCHNYVQLDPEAKLELHISSIILLKCLQFYTSDFPLNGETISQCVLLLAQIKVNSMAIIRIKSSDSSGNHTTSTTEQVRVGQAIYLTGSMFNHSCKPNIHTYFQSRILNIRAIDFIRVGQPLELSYGPQVGQWSCNERQISLKNQYAFICTCASCTKSNLSDLVINSYRCSNPTCFGVVLDRDLVNYEKRKVNPCDGVEYNEIKKVASVLCEETESTHRVEPGFCLNCGGYRDMYGLKETVKKGENYKGLLDSSEVVSSGLRCLDVLKSVLHPYNKKVAEVEDYVAQVFCSIGELQRARDHCKASIKILEKLYGEEHIVIGNELVKLASIQLSLGDGDFEKSRNRIELVFSRHYGSHVDVIFPHLKFLKKGP